jgi:hypothetical protein
MKNFIFCISFCLLAIDTNAAVVYETHREVIREDETEHFYERTTLKDDETRIDFIEADGSLSGSYILSKSGGQKWALNDAGKSICSTWTREEYFQSAAGVVANAKKLVKANITSIEQVKITDEPGTDMHGLSTRHVKIKSSYSGEGRMLFVKRTYAVEEIDEMWMTPDWEWPEHEYGWLEASAHTGNDFLDEHESKWLSHVIGPILKHVHVVTLTNVKNKKAVTKTENFSVTRLEEIPDDGLEKLFTWPECKPVDAKEMEHQATRMLKKHFK